MRNWLLHSSWPKALFTAPFLTPASFNASEVQNKCHQSSEQKLRKKTKQKATVKRRTGKDEEMTIQLNRMERREGKFWKDCNINFTIWKSLRVRRTEAKSDKNCCKKETSNVRSTFKSAWRHLSSSFLGETRSHFLHLPLALLTSPPGIEQHDTRSSVAFCQKYERSASNVSRKWRRGIVSPTSSVFSHVHHRKSGKEKRRRRTRVSLSPKQFAVVRRLLRSD